MIKINHAMNAKTIGNEVKNPWPFWLIISIIAIVLVIAFAILAPLIFTGKSNYYEFATGTGFIGDTIGGTMGPFIAIAAAGLTFLAFWIQYKANQEQREQFEKQGDDTVIERFENRFFEMIRIHRENVEEQNIQNIIYGRKAFTTYYFELRYIYFVLEKNYDENPSEITLNKEKLTNLAYLQIPVKLTM